jgi:hypothetical protein
MRTVGATATATVRVLVELGAYTSLGYWGASVRGAVALRAALAVLAPLAAILVWALYLSPRASRRLRDPAALVSELAIFGAAAAAVGLSSTTALAAAFAVAAALDAGIPAAQRPALTQRAVTSRRPGAGPVPALRGCHPSG